MAIKPIRFTLPQKWWLRWGTIPQCRKTVAYEATEQPIAQLSRKNENQAQPDLN